MMASGSDFLRSFSMLPYLLLPGHSKLKCQFEYEICYLLNGPYATGMDHPKFAHLGMLGRKYMPQNDYWISGMGTTQLYSNIQNQGQD